MNNSEYLKELASRGDGSLQAWFDAEHVDGGSHESREGYEERLYGVPVSDCPYCGCSRVVIHEWNENYEHPNSYRVEHVDEKEAFNCDCFTSYYAFDSVEKAVAHADARHSDAAARCADACPIDDGYESFFVDGFEFRYKTYSAADILGKLEQGPDANLVLELGERISEQDKRISWYADELEKRDKGIERLKARRDELAAERDYWRGQVELCMQSAYPPSHAPEPPYAPNVMAYPDRNGCTTPSTLVSAVIDELRDVVQDGYLKAKLGVVAELEAKLRALKAHGVEIVDAAAGGYEVYNEAAREREEMRGKLSKALGYAHDILALMD